MTYNETEILIQKYLNGETTAEEERLLALEVSRKDAPEDWKVIAEMLGELTVDEALFDQIMAERKQKPRFIRLWPWVAAACVAASDGSALANNTDTVIKAASAAAAMGNFLIEYVSVPLLIADGTEFSELFFELCFLIFVRRIVFSELYLPNRKLPAGSLSRKPAGGPSHNILIIIPCQRAL